MVIDRDVVSGNCRNTALSLPHFNLRRECGLFVLHSGGLRTSCKKCIINLLFLRFSSVSVNRPRFSTFSQNNRNKKMFYLVKSCQTCFLPPVKTAHVLFKSNFEISLFIHFLEKVSVVTVNHLMKREKHTINEAFTTRLNNSPVYYVSFQHSCFWSSSVSSFVLAGAFVIVHLSIFVKGFLLEFHCCEDCLSPCHGARNKKLLIGQQ